MVTRRNDDTTRCESEPVVFSRFRSVDGPTRTATGITLARVRIQLRPAADAGVGRLLAGSRGLEKYKSPEGGKEHDHGGPGAGVKVQNE